MPNYLVLPMAYLLCAAPQPPGPNTAKEPLAEKFSLARAATFLDHAALEWTKRRKCATCHTNVPYLMARPLVKEGAAEALAPVRQFFEKRVAAWKVGGPRDDMEVVITATALAFHDALTTGKLHATTRQAFDRLWQVQRQDGAFDWLECDWPPQQHDDYYGAVFAALGVGAAPEQYAQTPEARVGLAKLKDYLAKHPPPDLHHRTMLLWASLRVDGLMTAVERKAAIDALVTLQRGDGGWNLPSLGKYLRHDDTANNKNAPSDGYATGLVVYVLRQAGVPVKDERLRRGVAWLKANQRVSGRWFTRSLSNDRDHYLSHAGTALAVMALRACGED